MRERIKYIDNCRAICMLWIVGVWHLLGYCDNGWITNSKLAALLTYGSLATFTFISGLMLGKKKCLDQQDITKFWKNRFFRIYPLFFFSCTSLFIIYLIYGFEYINSWKQYIYTLIGIAPYVGESPQTIWYISMLISFYFISPLVTVIRDKKKRYSICLIIYMVLLYMRLTGTGIDTKVIILFPFYFFSLLFSDRIEMIIENRKNSIFLPMAVLLFYGVNKIINSFDSSFGLIILSSFAFIFIIICLCNYLSYYNYINKFLSIISYASMVAYLFHRQVYGFIQFAFFKSKGAVPIWVAYIIMLPLIIVFSFYLQKMYDAIVEKRNNSMSK